VGGLIAACCGLSVVAAVVSPPSAKATPTAVPAATGAPAATAVAVATQAPATTISAAPAAAPSATPRPEPTKPAPTATAKAAATLAPATQTGDAEAVLVKAYLLKVGEKSDAMGKAVKLFAGMMGEAGDKPTLLIDTDWKLKAAGAMALVQVSADELGEITPVPKSAAVLDGYFKKIKAETRVMVDNYAKGIDKLDKNSLLAGNDNMTAIAGYMQKAVGEIEKLAK
jgi:hypothetical protein